VPAAYIRSSTWRVVPSPRELLAAGVVVPKLQPRQRRQSAQGQIQRRPGQLEVIVHRSAVEHQVPACGARAMRGLECKSFRATQHAAAAWLGCKDEMCPCLTSGARRVSS